MDVFSILLSLIGSCFLGWIAKKVMACYTNIKMVQKGTRMLITTLTFVLIVVFFAVGLTPQELLISAFFIGVSPFFLWYIVEEYLEARNNKKK